MKKYIVTIILILFVTLSYCENMVPVSGGEFELEKIWTINIENNEKVSNLYLEVPVLYTSPAQTHSDVWFSRDYTENNGYYIIDIKNPGPVEKVVMKVTIFSDYDVWQISQPALKNDYNNITFGLDSGNLTTADLSLKKFAKTFDNENVYVSTIDIIEWVYHNVEYNDSYVEAILPATQTYDLRQGTCDEHSHLTIAMFRSIGIPSRFIKGYIYSFDGKSTDWQPHAWVEFYTPLYGWLPVDPTFNEYVYLSGQRVAFTSAMEFNDSMMDTIYSTGYDKFNVNFSSETKLKEIKNKPRQLEFYVSHDIETNDSDVKVKISFENVNNKYYFIPTVLLLPEEVGGRDKSITMLAPYEKKVILKKIDVTNLYDSDYKVPYYLRMFDYEYAGNFYTFKAVPEKDEKEVVLAMAGYWWIIFIPLIYMLIVHIYGRRL